MPLWPFQLPARTLTATLVVLGFLCASTAGNADIVTTLNFVSPGTASPLAVTLGTSVSFDLGVSFVPLAATTGTPEFVDDGTGNPVANCASDPNPCTELQFNTTASTLTSVFAEAVAGNVPGPPNFFPTTTLGATTFSQAYPDPGLWEITTTGLDQEQFDEIECTTQFIAEVPGAASCMTINTISFRGVFDPGGDPMIFVAAAAAVPEPSSLPLFALSALFTAAFFGSRPRANRRSHWS